MKRFSAFLYFCVCIMIAGLRTARAYIDPSSMTYIIQIIAGAAIAIGAGIGFYWKRIARWIRSKKEQSSDASILNNSENEPEDEVYDPTIVEKDEADSRDQ